MKYLGVFNCIYLCILPTLPGILITIHFGIGGLRARRLLKKIKCKFTRMIWLTKHSLHLYSISANFSAFFYHYFRIIIFTLLYYFWDQVTKKAITLKLHRFKIIIYYVFVLKNVSFFTFFALK